jgi:hypothetical protein
MAELIIPRGERHEVTVRQDGPRVLLVIDGRASLFPWNAALDLAAALREKGKAAEELAKAEGIIFDQALLIRRGLRFGLTSHPLLQREAAKESAWNRTLRRALPGGVKSQEQIGTPILIRHPPKKGA